MAFDSRAIITAHDNTVALNGADGKPATIAGRAVTIWRREPDGEWRCAVDIWNGAPAE